MPAKGKSKSTSVEQAKSKPKKRKKKPKPPPTDPRGIAGVENGRRTRFKPGPQQVEIARKGGLVTKKTRIERALGKELAKAGLDVDETLGKMYAKVVSESMKGGVPLASMIQAIRLISDYIVGKPVERVEFEGAPRKIILVDERGGNEEPELTGTGDEVPEGD